MHDMPNIYAAHADKAIERIWLFINEGNPVMAGFEARCFASSAFEQFKFLREDHFDERVKRQSAS